MRRRLDLATCLGVPLGVGLILVAQWAEGGGLGSLFQATAAAIVFGGTLGATLVSTSVADMRLALRGALSVWREDEDPTEGTLLALVHYAAKARRNGLIALEDELGQTEDPFLRRALGLAVDGTSPVALRNMLEAESANQEEHDERAAHVFEAAGGYAPTVGILGAVLGLIHVMENLSDPTKLGGGIAVAFVATVYGVGSANLLLLPIAAKLRHRARARSRHRELVIEGVLAVQAGLSPALVDQKLRGLVPGDTFRPTSRRAA